jgi:hypothetical protein
MRSRLGILIILCGLFVLPVRATIPLVEELSLQLPPCTSWDVQHGVDTNTFGYAYLRADTVYWAARVGDAEQFLKLPPDSFYCHRFPLGCESGYVDHDISPWGIRLLRHPLAPQHLWAIVQTNAFFRDDDYTWNYHYLLLYDLTIGQMADFISFDGGASIDGRWNRCSNLNDFTLWPSPPLVSTRLVISQYYSWSYDWHAGCAARSEYGRIIESDLTSSPFTIREVCQGTQARVFGSNYIERYAIMNYTYQWNNCDNIDTWHWMRTVRTLSPPTDTSDVSSDSNYVVLWTQTDGDGTQRIIIDYYWRSGGTIALNPDNGDTLWHMTEAIGGEAARFAGSADERILHGNAVYDASNGTYLDKTSSIRGSLRYVLRLPNRKSEFVTYEDGAHAVRIYTSLPPVPDGMTCRFIPETGMLRLRWHAEPSAVRYWIYASFTVDGQYWPIDHVDASATSYDISPASPHRFFRVTAEY